MTDEEPTQTIDNQTGILAKRENAWRVFAAEYNDSTYTFQNDDKSTPNYVLTPLGAKVNRLFFIGVVTECENIGSGTDPLFRARVSDPTGVFYLSAGRFQPEAATALADLNPPEIIAVVGKARTYTPDEGGFYVSVRPEVVWRVPPELREFWILETCKHTKTRLEAMDEALKMSEPSVEELIALGYSRKLSEGVLKAIEQYTNTDFQRYQALLGNVLTESLAHIEKPYYEPEAPSQATETTEPPPEATPEREAETPPTAVDEEPQEPSGGESPELEDQIIELIKTHYKEDVNGTMYQDLWKEASKLGLERSQVEECITLLEDKGLIYEPSIGILKLVNP